MDDLHTAPPSCASVRGEDDPLAFTPIVSATRRHDGWTPERQRRFIDALATMGVVSRAAKAVGKSLQSAYRLRGRAGAESFCEAWDLALQMAYDRRFEEAMDRALNGVVAPRYYRGQQIGTARRYDYRLALAVLTEPRVPPKRG